MQNWMARLDDKKPISMINVPGTHDSATKEIWCSYFLQNQNLTILEQLEAGFRFFDLRLRINREKKLFLAHTFMPCLSSGKTFYFEDVLHMMIAFLQDHPTEIIFMAVKAEKKKKNISLFQKLVGEMLENNETHFYLKEKIPSIQEVRGKIVLLRRYENVLNQKEAGIPFLWMVDSKRGIQVLLQEKRNVHLIVQDSFKSTIDDKWRLFCRVIANYQFNEQTFVLNYLSTTTKKLLSHPKVYAKILNARFLNLSLVNQGSYGFLIFNFGNEDIAKKVIETNFK